MELISIWGKNMKLNLSTIDVNKVFNNIVYDFGGSGIVNVNGDSSAEGETNYTYNILGKMDSKTDANGNTTTCTYDDLNRLIEMESQQITWPLLAPIRPPILSPTI